MAFRRLLPVIFLPILILAACSAPPVTQSPTVPRTTLVPSSTPTSVPTATPTLTPTPVPLVPNFQHIVMVVFENKEFGTVIGNPKMPYFNQLAQTYTLLTQEYAVTHPSLPNYLAMIGGDTFGITFDCVSCIVNEPSLPDQIEASGRTWKTYQEDMPSPCFAGTESGNYMIKHNPFMYFEPIRLNSARCNRSIVPLTQLSSDIAAGALPNFFFITPNLCNDAHDCDVSVADAWLPNLMNQLKPALDSTGKPYLVILTWDEGQGNHSCCGLPKLAGGRVATVFISPQAKMAFQDDTPYSHYSILKTIETAWNLKLLGHAADEQTTLITAPWK
ncbi:MAG: alkaline phosphatase family protein [Chloroflexi bacterium]|nr:alkaline phosphatase family protein [Chloroflexota bacterium]